MLVKDPEIAARLKEWYRTHGRDLPWRGTRDPYLIWVSEVILQQTRVAQGMGYYLRFIAEFPDVAALAAASEDRVLKCWQGLGYYSRARNLHAAAKQVMSLHGGVFPRDHAAVRALRGVGDYTAAAICSIAYDAPHAVLDGNVFRVLSRLYDLETPIDTTAGRREFALLAQNLLDARQPGLHNQAIMDFGALCCLPAQPLCPECPIEDRCLARGAGTVSSRPIVQKRTAVKPLYFNYLDVRCGDTLLLHRRDARDIWQGLYEFPLIETDRPMSYDELSTTPEFKAIFRGVGACRPTRTVGMPVHRLTHRWVHAVFHRVEVDRLPAMHEYLPVAEAALGDYAVPRLLDRYLHR